MAKLNLTLPYDEIAVTGKQVTFSAPCDSAGLTAVVIAGVEYTLVDTLGKPLHPHAFVKDALVTVILNIDANKAFVQESAHSYVDENFYNRGQIDAMFGSYVNDIANLLGGEAIADS